MNFDGDFFYRDALIQRSAQILATYRKNCASPTSSGQLILPECMKLLPLYANCLLNCDAVSGGQDIAIDDRRYNMYSVMTMHVAASLAYLYPRLVPLLDPSQEQGDDLKPVRCTVAKLRDDGVYVLDNGVYMFMWIGLTVNPEWIHNVFGSNSAAQIDIDRTRLVELDNPDSQQVISFLFDSLALVDNDFVAGESRHRPAEGHEAKVHEAHPRPAEGQAGVRVQAVPGRGQAERHVGRALLRRLPVPPAQGDQGPHQLKRGLLFALEVCSFLAFLYPPTVPPS